MKTKADLKRTLQIGTQLKRVYNSLGWGSGRASQGSIGTVSKVQTNGVYLDGRWLDIPVASLIEFDGTSLKLYYPGLRDLSPTEQDIIDNRPRDPEQERMDLLTDGSTMYWRDKRYFSEKEANWYWGWNKGLRYDHNEKKMWDRKIKGDLQLEYEVILD